VCGLALSIKKPPKEAAFLFLNLAAGLNDGVAFSLICSRPLEPPPNANANYPWVDIYIGSDSGNACINSHVC